MQFAVIEKTNRGASCGANEEFYFAHVIFEILTRHLGRDANYINQQI